MSVETDLMRPSPPKLLALGGDRTLGVITIRVPERNVELLRAGACERLEQFEELLA
jgi:hypothetical protein